MTHNDQPYVRKSANERKRDLIEAAFRCLTRNGYCRTTVKEIADEASANHGLIHHYFGSKEELVVQTIRTMMMERFFSRATREGEKAPDSRERFRALVKQALTHRKEEQLWFALLGELQAEAARNPRIKEAVTGPYEELWRREAELIRDVSDDFDPHKLAQFVQASLDGIALQWGANPESFDLEGTIDILIRLILERSTPTKEEKNNE